MAIIKCVSTTNITNLDKYLLDEPPHEKTDVVTQRNLGIWSQNIDKTYDNKYNAMYIASQQWAVRKVYGKQKKKTKGFHIIVSFSNEDFPEAKTKKEQAEQVKQAYRLLNGFFRKELPKTSQYFGVFQRDGDGHKLHAHIALNSVDMDGRTFNTNILSMNRRLDKNPDRIARKEHPLVKSDGLYKRFQDYCAEKFPEITKRPYKKILRDGTLIKTGAEGALDHRLKKEGKEPYSWKEDLISVVGTTATTVNSLDEFKSQLDNLYGVKVKERRASYIDENGEKKKRLAYTYCQTDLDGKVIHKARDFRYNKDGSIRGLGKMTTPQSIQAIIDREIQLRMAKEQQEREEKNREAILKAKKLKQQKQKQRGDDQNLGF